MSEGSDLRSEHLRKQLEQGLPAGVPGWLPHQDPLPFLLKQHVLLLPLLDKVEPGLVRLLRLLKPRVVVLLLLLVNLLLLEVNSVLWFCKSILSIFLVLCIFLFC